MSSSPEPVATVVAPAPAGRPELRTGELDPARRRRRARRRRHRADPGHPGREHPRGRAGRRATPSGWAEGRREADEPRPVRRRPRSRAAPTRTAEARREAEHAGRAWPRSTQAAAALRRAASPELPPGSTTRPSELAFELTREAGRPRARRPRTPAPTRYAGRSRVLPGRTGHVGPPAPRRSPRSRRPPSSPTAASPSSPTPTLGRARRRRRVRRHVLDRASTTALAPSPGGARDEPPSTARPAASAPSAPCAPLQLGRVAELLGLHVLVTGLPAAVGDLRRGATARQPVLAEVVASGPARPDLPAARRHHRPARRRPGPPHRRAAAGPGRRRRCCGRVLDGLGRPVDGGPSLDGLAAGRASSTARPTR